MARDADSNASGDSISAHSEEGGADLGDNGRLSSGPSKRELTREEPLRASGRGDGGSSPLVDFDPFAPYRGAVRRFFTVARHVMGLLMGGHIAYVRSLPDVQKTGIRSPAKRALAALLTLLVRSDLRDRPFPEQFRRRLEILGPTFTKLGQIMAIREDLLPAPITRELDSLMDHLPAIPFEQSRPLSSGISRRRRINCSGTLTPTRWGRPLLHRCTGPPHTTERMWL
jgi:ubiquinone biosynthesis protein